MALSDIRWKHHFCEMLWGIISNRLSIGIYVGIALIAAALVSQVTRLPVYIPAIIFVSLVVIVNPPRKIREFRSKRGE
ncbi:hypothetical protein GGE07_005252 [Sinorhizobium terangae]|nr:hypothetical protein [Sinorhizobium terangae]